MNLKPITVYTIEFEIEKTESIDVSYLKISDVTCFHNFFVNSEEPSVILSRILTDMIESKSVTVHSKQLASIKKKLNHKIENTYKAWDFNQ